MLMKKTLFLLLFVFIVNCCFAQWMIMNSATTNNLKTVKFPVYNRGLIAGENMFRWSGTSPYNWVGMGASNRVYHSIDCINVDTCFVVGGTDSPFMDNYGFVRQTTSWGSGLSNVKYISDTLHSVCFVSNTTGFAVGNNGKIFKTTDKGANWIASTSGTTNHLMSVCFTDINNGYIVGKNGIVLKTSNSGVTWVNQVSGTSNNLYSVFFTNNLTGFAVGENGIILKTTNGGSVWSSLTSFATVDLRSVFFPTSNIGYAVGFSGTIIRTENAGDTWTSQPSGTSNNLYSVYFTSQDTGYVVGDDGVMRYTFNGGVDIADYYKKSEEIKVFPNPVYDIVYVSNNSNEKVFVEIQNANGLFLRIFDIEELDYSLDLSYFAPGIYFLKFIKESGIEVKKILKM
jgi:hypothetical protein